MIVKFTVNIPDDELAELLSKDNISLQAFTEAVRRGLGQIKVNEICHGATSTVKIIFSEQ